MWLVEKSREDLGEFLPINLDNVVYIEKDYKNNSKNIMSYAIKFVFVFSDGNSGGKQWVKWWFVTKEARDNYLQKIHDKLPRLNLGIDEITL